MSEIPEDPNVEDWIGGVSFVQTTETIYRNPALWAEYEPILNEMTALGEQLDEIMAASQVDSPDTEESLGGGDETLGARPVASPVGEESLGEEPQDSPDVASIKARFAELKRQADEVLARYEGDTEVWHFRALDREDEITPITEELQVAEAVKREPRPVGTGATPQKIAAYRRKYEAWDAEMKALSLEVNLRCVALACLKVVVAGEEKPAPSVEGLRRLLTRPRGKAHFRQLVEAVERISLKEVEFAAPHREGS